VKLIDYLVIKHYHGDPGGVPQLAAKIAIGKMFDHGDSFEKSNAKTQAVFQPYEALREKYPHVTLRPGDTVPIKGLKVEVVAADGDAATPLRPPGRRWTTQSALRQLRGVEARPRRKRALVRHDH
jgi:beta-lactamase superfamily II metal-dependent hydrolase